MRSSNVIQFTTIGWRKILCCSANPTDLHASVINQEIT